MQAVLLPSAGKGSVCIVIVFYDNPQLQSEQNRLIKGDPAVAWPSANLHSKLHPHPFQSASIMIVVSNILGRARIIVKTATQTRASAPCG